MLGMFLPGDGIGERSRPAPGRPYRGWTEGRRRDPAGGPKGNLRDTSRRSPPRHFRFLPMASLGILIRPCGLAVHVQKPGRTGISWRFTRTPFQESKARTIRVTPAGLAGNAGERRAMSAEPEQLAREWQHLSGYGRKC